MPWDARPQRGLGDGCAGKGLDPVSGIRTLLANLIVDEPVAVTTLLEQHVDDGHGHCRTCTLGGQRGNQTWPCTIYAAAVIAAKRSWRDR